MRILQVVNDVDDTYGGPAVAVKNLAEALSANGCEVEIYSTNKDIKKTKPSPKKGYIIYEFPRKRPYQYYYSPYLGERLAGTIRSFDVVHIYGIWTYPVYITSKLCNLFKIPFIIKTCGMLDRWSVSQKKIKKFFYYHLIEKHNLRKAAFIQFSTPKEYLKSVIDIPRSHFKFVPDIINFDEIKISNNQLNDCLKNKKYILFFGRLDKKKGLTILIKAFHRLVRDPKYRDIHLVFMGKGKKIVKDLKNNIIDLGMVYGKERFTVVKNAQFVSLPSYQEDMGLSIVESLACGVPVLISLYIDIGDLILAKEVGMVCKMNYISLCESMKEMIGFREDEPDIAKRAQAFAYNEFSRDKVLSLYINMYKEAINRNRINNR